MAVRPIDAEKYMELLKEQYLHNKSMGNSQAARAWQGAIQLLYDMPTLTPQNEPLTIQQLREMDGEPVWFKGIGKTGIHCDGWCEAEIREKDPFAYVWWPGSEVEDIAKIEDYGKAWACYAYPPAHIDREAWKCPLCETSEVISFEAWEDESKFPKGPSVRGAALFCPHCGKPRTPEAWAEMKKRMGGISNG